MHNPLILDRTDPYLSSQWRESSAPFPRQTTPPFITISRESGSGGTRLARMLARSLNGETPSGLFWQVNEGNLTEKMLQANHLPKRIGRFLPEDHISEIESSVGEIVGLHPNLWELTRKTCETIEDLARNGHAIIVGRGANFATSRLPQGLHVRLVAPAEHRADYMVRWYGLSKRAAVIYNAKRDSASRRYVKHTFNTDIEDPTAYDLIINTGRVSLSDAAQIVLNRVRSLM